MEKKASFNLAGKEEFEHIMEVFGRCTDDYLFLLDLDNGDYIISQRALEKFNLPSTHFSNAGKVLEQVIYPEDFPALSEDLDRLKYMGGTEHDMEYRWMDREGRLVWISCRGVVIQDTREMSRMLVGRITEIGSKRKADDVTGLFAERQFQLDYKKIRKKGRRGTLLRIGVDNFKEVNERYGIEVGDGVLKMIAQCMEQVSGTERCYKVNGDEFLVLLMEDDVQEARKKYHQVRILI